MNVQLSNRIKVLSFIATVFVVYRHSLNYLAFFNTWTASGLNGWIQDGVMVLTQVAVPYFFLVSGYFFFRKDYYNHQSYFKMITTKVRTLLVPFFIWNIVGLFCLIVTRQIQSFDSFGQFLVNILQSKYYGPLWYIRDLMILMLFAPLYQWVYRVNSIFLYLIIALCLYFYWLPVDNLFLSTEGVFFFFLAGIISHHDNILTKSVPKEIVIVLTIIWLLLCFTTPLFQYIHKFCTILGVICFWLLSETNIVVENKLLLHLSKYSFLIYVLHFFPLKIMKIALGRLFFGNEWVSLFSYLLLPLVCVCIIIVLGYLMQKYFPKLFAVSMGGRV